MKVPALFAAIILAGVFAVPAQAAPRPPDQVRVRPLDMALEVIWLRSPDDPVYVSGYEVVRAVFQSGPYQPVCVTLKGATSCVDRKVQPEKTYFYKVRALGIGDEGRSEFTTEMRAEGPRPPQPEQASLEQPRPERR